LKKKRNVSRRLRTEVGASAKGFMHARHGATSLTVQIPINSRAIMENLQYFF
jgi:hypothetical protein